MAMCFEASDLALELKVAYVWPTDALAQSKMVTHF